MTNDVAQHVSAFFSFYSKTAAKTGKATQS
jgi:hypothetical protein